MSTPKLSVEVRSYKFGSLEFRTPGAGVFCPSEKLLARIASMEPDALRAANKAAWKAKRAAARSVEKCGYGGDWDTYAHDENVAEVVCKTTYRALQGSPLTVFGSVYA